MILVVNVSGTDFCASIKEATAKGVESAVDVDGRYDVLDFGHVRNNVIVVQKFGAAEGVPDKGEIDSKKLFAEFHRGYAM